jgi:Flp pilus assembly protein TadD
LRFLEQALQEEQGADAGPHLLRGRLLQELGRNDEAESAYRQSAQQGLPAPRVLPYLAELAFARRDFDEVTRLLGELRAYPDQPRLQPVLRLWGLT